MEVCANCNRQIGNLETPHLWQGNVVCEKCNRRLASKSKKTIWRVAIAILGSICAVAILLIRLHGNHHDLGHSSGLEISSENKIQPVAADNPQAVYQDFKQFSWQVLLPAIARSESSSKADSDEKIDGQVISTDIKTSDSLIYPCIGVASIRIHVTSELIFVTKTYELQMGKTKNGWVLAKATLNSRSVNQTMPSQTEDVTDFVSKYLQ